MNMNLTTAARLAGTLAVAATAASASPQQIPRAPDSRAISEIIVHCSATPAGRDVGVDDIRRWHLARGFSDVGYHFVVRLDGTIEPGRPLAKVGAHCLGHNARSIGVCYVGGCDARMRPADTRTAPQRQSLEMLLATLLRLYPGAAVYGHRDFANKACPSFDATAEYHYLTR